jgi:hypothetical protein
MIARKPSFIETIAPLLVEFFEKHPNNDLRDRVSVALAKLARSKTNFPGKPEGWAAGIVFALGSRGCGVPNVLNSELEKAFGATMSTIYKRAWAVKRLLGLCPGL